MTACLGQDTMFQSSQIYSELHKGPEDDACFLLIRLTNFALGITRQNPRAHILLSQDEL